MKFFIVAALSPTKKLLSMKLIDTENGVSRSEVLLSNKN
jgi:hypothetical protein